MKLGINHRQIYNLSISSLLLKGIWLRSPIVSLSFSCGPGSVKLLIGRRVPSKEGRVVIHRRGFRRERV